MKSTASYNNSYTKSSHILKQLHQLSPLINSQLPYFVTNNYRFGLVVTHWPRSTQLLPVWLSGNALASINAVVTGLA